MPGQTVFVDKQFRTQRTPDHANRQYPDFMIAHVVFIGFDVTFSASAHRGIVFFMVGLVVIEFISAKKI